MDFVEDIYYLTHFWGHYYINFFDSVLSIMLFMSLKTITSPQYIMKCIWSNLVNEHFMVWAYCLTVNILLFTHASSVAILFDIFIAFFFHECSTDLEVVCIFSWHLIFIQNSEFQLLKQQYNFENDSSLPVGTFSGNF